MKFTNKELNPPKFREAINEQCRECIYDVRGHGTWRQQIEDCTSKDCSLYPVRPITSNTTKLRAEARRKYPGAHLSSGAFKPLKQQ